MILALGTGRSGTSDVARILEEQGVMMGHRFHMGDEFNPRGYFEDRDFQELNMMYVMLGLGENPKGDQLKLWLDRFNKLINTRQEPWGLKDPGIADFPELLDHYMKLNPKVILCERNREDTVASFIRMKFKGGMTREKAEHIYDNRTKNIKKALKEYLTIDCYDINKEYKIATWLKKHQKSHT